jgi:hypothetical protein
MVFTICQLKKRTVTLNLAIGTLHVYPNLTTEFKSIGQADHSKQLDFSSMAYNSLGTLNPEKRNSILHDNSISRHKSMKQRHISSLFRDHNDHKDYSHLSNFLKN